MITARHDIFGAPDVKVNRREADDGTKWITVSIGEGVTKLELCFFEGAFDAAGKIARGLQVALECEDAVDQLAAAADHLEVAVAALQEDDNG